MKKENIIAISALLAADPTVTDEHHQQILEICKNKKTYTRRDLISRAEVFELLQISGPTLLKYIRAGKITEVRMSPRKIRFIRQQVMDFLCHGEACGMEHKEVAR